jgi:hypothetical protein
MNSEEIEKSKHLFPSLDHWLAFHELADKRPDMFESWFVPATERIRAHFKQYPAEGWQCIPHPLGQVRRDTIWYLEEFGPNSLRLVYGWYYELQLRLDDFSAFDSNCITQALEGSEFESVKRAFGRIDRYMLIDSKLMERRNFEFGMPNDRNLSERELAWAAAFHTEAFVDQVIRKIERFTKDPEVTRQIRNLNVLGRDAAAQRASATI